MAPSLQKIPRLTKILRSTVGDAQQERVFRSRRLPKAAQRISVKPRAVR